MSVSFYSGLMAILWFTVFIAIGNFLRDRAGFLLHYSVFALFSLIILSMVRLLVPLEFGFTRVIRTNAFLTELFGAVSSPLPLPFRASVFEILLFFWIAVALYNIARFMRHIWHDRRVLGTITPVDDSRIARCLAGIAGKTKPRKKYKLLVSEDVIVPALVGVVRPTILAPQNDLSDEQLYCLLAHEWQHVLNGDPWIKLTVRLVRCVMWWIPPVRAMEKNVDEVLESRCDLALTGDMGRDEKLTYLKTLCLTYDRAIHGDGQTNFALASGFVRADSDKTVMERFELISKYQKGVKASTVAFLLVMALSFACSYLFVIQPYHEVPTNVHEENVICFTPENAFIQMMEDGKCRLIYNGKVFMELTANDIKSTPFNQLPIVEER